jgi:nucleotide-binding universal stress UspA family protein
MVIDTIKISGDVQQEIKNKIKELKIDLLIIGELPSIRSRRDETYNEAERLMRSVSCPVLIVKNENFVDEIFNG